jgi:hypothetical protein
VRQNEFREAIDKQAEMMTVMAEEQMLSPMGEYWQIQARLYNSVRDVANAKRYARMALEDLDTFGSGELDEDVEAMRLFVEGKK